MHRPTQPPKILDCTLRDGSYAIDFQFTAEDTARITAALDEVGFEYIEVGHGIGLGASERGMGVAAATDLEYMAAAARSVKTARWGMFCIPGVASLECVDQAADQGMGFIRIGSNAEAYAKAQPFIERAKKRGLYVCANFMKSYCLPPRKFADMAVDAVGFGADVVYIVDSAGGMLGDELSRYISATLERSPNMTLGFHGHNNLGLANGNSYSAWQQGCTFIDSSLMGLGRSSGNAITEQLVSILVRAGVEPGIDPIAVLDVAEHLIRPIFPAHPPTSLDVTAGLSLFHSSYMPTILEAAKRYRVDARRLILAVTKISTAEAPANVVDACARKLAQDGVVPVRTTAHLRNYIGREQDI